MASSEERLVFEIFARDRGASRTFDQVGRAAGKAGDDIKGMGKESSALDKQISETRTHLKGLIGDFEKTGDKDLFPKIRKDRSTLAFLESLKKKISEVDEAGSGILSGLAAKPALIAALVPVAAALLPPLGAAIGGAVLGGVGAGGIIGGIVLASKDDRVRAAGSELGRNLLGDLRGAATPFIQPLVDSFDELEETGASFTASLHNGFSKLAPLIGPLTKGVDGFVRGLGNGLEKLFGEGAPPALRALADELPEIGDSIGDMFASISDGSDGATMGLIEFLHIMEDATRFTGEFIRVLSDVFEWEVKTGYGATAWADSWLSGVEKATRFTGLLNIATDQYRGVLAGLNEEDASLIEGLNKANDATNDWNGSLRDLRDTTKEEAEKLKDLNSAIDDYLGKTLSVPEAQIRLNKQWADTVETLTEGRRTLKLNTEAGQDNKQALIDMIQAAEALREAEFAKTGSLDDANAAYDAQLERLRNLAIKLHFNKTQVDELINSVKVGNALGGLTVPVTMPGLDKYLARLNYFVAQLGAVKGMAAAEFATYREDERNPSGKRAAGGPVMAGNTYWVGERGPELVTFGHNGTVIPSAQSQQMLSGASGGSAPQVVLKFPAFTGDPIFDAILRLLREGVTVEGSGSVSAYFGGAAA